MAGERRVKVSVSVSPLVKKSDADADDTYKFLHDIKGSLGGTYNLDSADGDDLFYYAPNIIVTNSSEHLIANTSGNSVYVGSSGNQNDYNEDGGSDVLFTNGADLSGAADFLFFLYIKNTGTSDINNTTTTNSIAFNLNNNSNELYNDNDAFELRPGEVFAARIRPNSDMAVYKLIAQSLTENCAGAGAVVNGSSSVRATVFAVIKS